LAKSNLSECDVTKIRFILDEMCGKLARWLRLLGFDTRYLKSSDLNDKLDDLLLSRAILEQRILVSKDIELIQRSKRIGLKSILLRENNLIDELKHILITFLNCKKITIFPRCPFCNSEIKFLSDKHKLSDNLVKKVIREYEEIYMCPKCNKIYWFGSHWKSISKVLEKVGIEYVIKKKSK